MSIIVCEKIQPHLQPIYNNTSCPLSLISITSLNKGGVQKIFSKSRLTYLLLSFIFYLVSFHLQIVILNYASYFSESRLGIVQKLRHEQFCPSHEMPPYFLTENTTAPMSNLEYW